MLRLYMAMSQVQELEVEVLLMVEVIAALP
jgi:hypothetical protein